MKLVYNVGVITTLILFVTTMLCSNDNNKLAFLFALNIIHIVFYTKTMRGLIQDKNAEENK